MRTAIATVVLSVLVAACAGGASVEQATTVPAPVASSSTSVPSVVVPDVTVVPVPTPAATASTSSSPAVVPTAPMTTTPSAVGRTTLRYRLEVMATDLDAAVVAATVHAVLTDGRGWVRAGFDLVPEPDGEFLIVIAEGDEVDRRCLPLDTSGRFSCQNGPVVALNADRWRNATPQWTGSLEDYRVMLVNHEVGHLLHLHHPRPQCPGVGLPAPIMLQQSTELGDCTANPWPLTWEIDLAATRSEPLAPPPDHDVSDHRPSPPPQEQTLP